MSNTVEVPARIEPCLLEEANTEIVDLVAALSAAAHTLGARLHPLRFPLHATEFLFPGLFPET